MNSLAYQQNTEIHPGAMINRAQAKAAPDHEKIRDAVRAWSSALDNQDVVSALIINEYREQGGTAISFPEDISRARQKLFRFLDRRCFRRGNYGPIPPPYLRVGNRRDVHLPEQSRNLGDEYRLPPDHPAELRVPAAAR